MDGRTRRRSSILKQQQPFHIGSQEYGEVSVTASNFIKRRVSFHNMRTVQEFDQERNDITRSPQKEPIKLGDTGSSDGLQSTRVSTFMSHTEREKPDETVGFDRTVDMFVPVNTSTPMPRSGVRDSSSRINTMLLFDANATFGPHGDTTLRCFDFTSDYKCNNVTETNATNALFGSVPIECGRNEGLQDSVVSAGNASYGVCGFDDQDDEMTRQLFGFSVKQMTTDDDKVKEAMEVDADLTDNIFRMSIQEVGEKLSENIREIALNGEPGTFVGDAKPVEGFADDVELASEVADLEPSLTLADVEPASTRADVESASIHTDVKLALSLENLERASSIPDAEPTSSVQHLESMVMEPGSSGEDVKYTDGDTSKKVASFRVADSPLAVMKKKTRLESPFKKDASMPSRFNSDDSGSLNSDLFRRPLMFSTETLKNSSSNLQHTPFRDLSLRDERSVLEEGTFLQLSPALQAIAKTKRHIRQSLDQSTIRASAFSSPMLMLQDIMRPKNSLSSMSDEQESECIAAVTAQSPSCFRSMIRSFTNERAVERTYVSSFEDTTSDPVSNWINESCALTCRFDSVDFDIRIGEVPCFQSEIGDHAIISRLREVARRNICKELANLNAELEIDVENDLRNLATKDRRLANAIKMLNPKKLSRDEVRGFEICRLKAQKTWYGLRHNVAFMNVEKTTELINQRKDIYNKISLENDILEQYRLVEPNEKDHLKNSLENLRNIERLAMTGFEKNKVELASLSEAADFKLLENIRIKTDIVRLETEEIRKRTDVLRIEKARTAELFCQIDQASAKARQFCIETVLNGHIQ